jgi:hypothetical protein
MTYEVKYRACGSFFWKKIKRVKADLILSKESAPVRVLILEDESRLEIPIANNEFCFSKERFLVILKSQEKESGQKMPV